MAQQANPLMKFGLDRTVTGDITFFEMSGVIDEGFEAKKAAESVRTKKVVLDLGKTRRFASWGMAQWTEFVRVCGTRDVYVVECSPQALGQFNLVTGLLGHAKLVSFYASFRCVKCGEESDSLLVVPSDRDQLADAEQTCVPCGGVARMDKYTETMCEAIAAQAPYDVEDDVITFLRSRYRYDIKPDLQRFRAGRRSTKGATYLRLTGDVTGVPEALAAACEGMTVLDLAGVTLPSMEAKAFAPWRTFLRGALPNVTSLQLLDCPVGFLEQAITADDLIKVKVRSFALAYPCATCGMTSTQNLDVATNLEHLIDGRIPAMPCTTCKEPTEATVSSGLSALIRRLPAREVDPARDKFLDKARAEPAQALEDGLAARAVAPKEKAPGGQARTLYIASALLVLAAAVFVAFGLGMFKDRDRAAPVVAGADTIVAPRPVATVERPDWVVSDLPLSAFCHDLVNRLMCVGVSSYRGSRDEALVDANEAALDELLFTVGLKISDPFFRDTVIPMYSETRSKALAALQAADTARTGNDYMQAAEVIRTSRKRVVQLLKASGGPAVPAQRSDWYWEEYASDKGSGSAGTESLVFVRYDVSLDVLKALVERFGTTSTVLGSTVLTAFPALAWGDAGFPGGAMVVAPEGPLATAGIAAKDVISAAADKRVTSAAELAPAAEGTGVLTLSVRSNGAQKSVPVTR